MILKFSLCNPLPSFAPDFPFCVLSLFPPGRLSNSPFELADFRLPPTFDLRLVFLPFLHLEVSVLLFFCHVLFFLDGFLRPPSLLICLPNKWSSFFPREGLWSFFPRSRDFSVSLLFPPPSDLPSMWPPLFVGRLRTPFFFLKTFSPFFFFPSRDFLHLLPDKVMNSAGHFFRGWRRILLVFFPR